MLLSTHQTEVLDQIVHWIDNFDVEVKPRYILTGFAGVGKTTLITNLVKNLNTYIKLDDKGEDSKKIAVVTLTWKAANVLRQKGLDEASSIHRLIYNSEVNPVTKEVEFRRKSTFEVAHKYSLIICDEASMTDKVIRADIESFKIPVLYVGDNFQLPSISKDPENANFLLNPDSQLTEIHRQALDSPIIQMSMAIRNGQRMFANGTNVDNQVFVFSKKDVRGKWLLDADQVICGYNKTRIELNRQIRAAKGHNPSNYPNVGEKLVALSNCREKEIYNGQSFTCAKDYTASAHKPNEYRYLSLINDDDDKQFVKTIFTDLKTPEFILPYGAADKQLVQMGYAYAITCHKAQGSQYDKIVIHNEPIGNNEEEKARWLYTAITRAVKKLILLQ